MASKKARANYKRKMLHGHMPPEPMVPMMAEGGFIEPVKKAVAGRFAALDAAEKNMVNPAPAVVPPAAPVEVRKPITGAEARTNYEAMMKRQAEPVVPPVKPRSFLGLRFSDGMDWGERYREEPTSTLRAVPSSVSPQNVPTFDKTSLGAYAPTPKSTYRYTPDQRSFDPHARVLPTVGEGLLGKADNAWNSAVSGMQTGAGGYPILPPSQLTPRLGDQQDQVYRSPMARRTELAKTLQVGTSYDELGRPLGWRPAEGPEDTEGLDIGQVTRGLRNYADGGSMEEEAELRSRAFANGGTPVLDYAVHGGKVVGKGGPTEDKQPILASPGEFMLPADTVKQVGPHNLRRLVAQTHNYKKHHGPGFSIGGYLGGLFGRGAKKAKDAAALAREAAERELAAGQDAFSGAYGEEPAAFDTRRTVPSRTPAPETGFEGLRPRDSASTLRGARAEVAKEAYDARYKPFEPRATEPLPESGAPRVPGGAPGKYQAPPKVGGLRGAWNVAQKFAVPAALAAAGTDTYFTDTEDYRTRLKEENKKPGAVANLLGNIPGTDPDLWDQLGTRAIGAASDVGNAFALGIPKALGLYRDVPGVFDPYGMRKPVVGPPANLAGPPASDFGPPSNLRGPPQIEPFQAVPYKKLDDNIGGPPTPEGGQTSIDNANAVARAKMDAIDQRHAAENITEGQRLDRMRQAGQLATDRHELDVASSVNNRKLDPGRYQNALRNYALTQQGGEADKTRAAVRDLKSMDVAGDLAKAKMADATARYGADIGLRGHMYTADQAYRGHILDNQRLMATQLQGMREKHGEDFDKFLNNSAATFTTDKDKKQVPDLAATQAKKDEFMRYIYSPSVNNAKFLKEFNATSIDDLPKSQWAPLWEKFQNRTTADVPLDSGDESLQGMPTGVRATPTGISDWVDTRFAKDKTTNAMGLGQTLWGASAGWNPLVKPEDATSITISTAGRVPHRVLFSDLAKDPHKAIQVISDIEKTQGKPTANALRKSLGLPEQQ